MIPLLLFFRRLWGRGKFFGVPIVKAGRDVVNMRHKYQVVLHATKVGTNDHLSFAEYFEFSGLSDKSEALSNYMIWGGMPLAVIDPDDASRAEYLKALFDKVYLKDIRERNKLRGTTMCELVLNELCSS